MTDDDEDGDDVAFSLPRPVLLAAVLDQLATGTVIIISQMLNTLPQLVYYKDRGCNANDAQEVLHVGMSPFQCIHMALELRSDIDSPI